MIKKTTLLLTSISYIFANPFQATLQNEISWLKEETFVISASKVKENIDKTPSSVYIITQEMINTMEANNILDVLETVPGIGITPSNTGLKEIEIRGIKDWFSKQVLFMIDGHSLDANLLNGGATRSFGPLSLDNISRIEIIKGPASAVYGANAFTALINIITKSVDEIKGTVIKTKIGSFNSKESHLLHGKKYKDLSVILNLNIKKTDGSKQFIKQDKVANSGYTNPYLKELEASIKLNYKNFDFTTMYIKREDGQYYGALGELTDETVTKSDYLFSELKYNKNIAKDLDITAKFYTDKYTFDNKWELEENGKKMINALTNQKNGIESFLSYQLNNKYNIITGLMYEKQKQYDDTTIQNFDPIDYSTLDSMTDYSGTQYSFPTINRNMWAAYINNLYDFSDHIRLTFGVRYDKYDDFDSNISSKSGIAWQINPHNTFKFMYGEGFRAPTFAELYNSNVVVSGNTTLKSERVDSYETSLNTEISKSIETKITLFNNDYKDLIVKSGNIYNNVGKTNTKGLEFEIKYKLKRGSYFMVNYTYQKAKDKLTNEDLPNIPEQKANIFLNYRLANNINMFNHIYIKGSTKREDGDDRDTVSSFAIANSSIIIKNLYQNVQIKASINNLFNKEAYDPSSNGLIEDDYEKEGRNISLTLSYNF